MDGHVVKWAGRSTEGCSVGTDRLVRIVYSGVATGSLRQIATPLKQITSAARLRPRREASYSTAAARLISGNCSLAFARARTTSISTLFSLDR
jgi:hypothetical protein